MNMNIRYTLRESLMKYPLIQDLTQDLFLSKTNVTKIRKHFEALKYLSDCIDGVQLSDSPNRYEGIQFRISESWALKNMPSRWTLRKFAQETILCKFFSYVAPMYEGNETDTSHMIPNAQFLDLLKFVRKYQEERYISVEPSEVADSLRSIVKGDDAYFEEESGEWYADVDEIARKKNCSKSYAYRLIRKKKISLLKKSPFSTLESLKGSFVASKKYQREIASTSTCYVNCEAVDHYIKELMLIDVDLTDVQKYKLHVQLMRLRRLRDELSLGGMYEVMYYKSPFGRIYEFGMSLQGLMKEIREAVLSDYYSVDMCAAVVGVMLSFSDKLGYDGSTKTIREYFLNKDAIRCKLAKELDIPVEDAKRILTAGCYGASLAHGELGSAVASSVCLPEIHSVLVKELGYDVEKAFHVTEHPFIFDFFGEVGQLSRWIGTKYTDRKEKLVFAPCGHIEGKATDKAILSYDRYSYRRVMAFIYQNEEAVMLKHMRECVESMGGEVGLLLHDGLYFRQLKEESFDSLGSLIVSRIKEETGNEIAIEIEGIRYDAPSKGEDDLKKVKGNVTLKDGGSTTLVEDASRAFFNYPASVPLNTLEAFVTNVEKRPEAVVQFNGEKKAFENWGTQLWNVSVVLDRSFVSTCEPPLHQHLTQAKNPNMYHETMRYMFLKYGEQPLVMETLYMKNVFVKLGWYDYAAICGIVAHLLIQNELAKKTINLYGIDICPAFDALMLAFTDPSNKELFKFDIPAGTALYKTHIARTIQTME